VLPYFTGAVSVRSIFVKVSFDEAIVGICFEPPIYTLNKFCFPLGSCIVLLKVTVTILPVVLVSALTAFVAVVVGFAACTFMGKVKKVRRTTNKIDRSLESLNFFNKSAPFDYLI
jgi:hypothetical protein